MGAHFVLVPLMAQGHTIPMTDMARLLALRGAAVTFVTTPVNASRIHPSALENVTVLSLPFPCAEAGLPDGCENIDLLPHRELLANFVHACVMLRQPLADYLSGPCRPRPDCIISDAAHYWTGDIARELGIPRLTFIGFGAFPYLCRFIIQKHGLFDDVRDDDELVPFPGFPHHLEISKSQAPLSFGGNDAALLDIRAKSRQEELRADGLVVNSFYELETLYVDTYREMTGKKVWTVGPLLLCDSEADAIANRGRKASVDHESCQRWLDGMEDGSVLYVSFGSLAKSSVAQLKEIGLGLEASGRPFIWVIKSAEIEEWLQQDGFEERIVHGGKRGLIIRGWSPQVMILNHPAVGGFMTHCGWNSVLESVTAGVPMITWPHFAEQFLNEKLVVDILEIGVKVGVERKIEWGVQVEEKVMAGRDAVQMAVSQLMDDGEVAQQRRVRARDLSAKAKRAMEEGGSSFLCCKQLIEEAAALHGSTATKEDK